MHDDLDLLIASLSPEELARLWLALTEAISLEERGYDDAVA